MNPTADFPAALDLLTAEHEAHSRVLEIQDEMRRARQLQDYARHAALGTELLSWIERRDSLHHLYRRSHGAAAR